MGVLLFWHQKDIILSSNNSSSSTDKPTNLRWVLMAIIVIGLLAWFTFSQAKNKSEYNDALRVTGARIECRNEAKQEGWTEAESGCDKLGTPGYDISTDDYFNAYKLRTGAKEL